MVPHSLANDNSVSRVSHQGGVVGDNWGGVNSMGQRGGMDSMGQGGVMGDNRSGVSDERGVVSGVGNNRGMMGGGGVGGLRVGLSLVSHISDKSVLVICVVRHNLDTAVRELHSVFS